MLKSMTGYGCKSEILNTKKISAEIKSLNSKSFNPYIKLPEHYSEKEIEIKNILYEYLKGGKVNFTLQIEDESNINNKINKNAVQDYIIQLKTIAKENKLDINDDKLLQSVLNFPDVLQSEEKQLDEAEWSTIKNLIFNTLKEIDKFRIQEGKALEKDISEKILAVKSLVPKLEMHEDERIDSVKNRLNARLNIFLNADEQNKDRFEQEIIYYLDKFDLNEEKTRLINHCDYFFETMKTDEPIGAKLGFIAQEIGREINTIGSKANHSEIQKIVVAMKDNLAKVKEQLLNIL